MKIAMSLALAMLLAPGALAQTPASAPAAQPAAAETGGELRCGFIILAGSACAARNAERRTAERAARIARYEEWLRTTADTPCTAGYAAMSGCRSSRAWDGGHDWPPNGLAADNGLSPADREGALYTGGVG